MTMAYVIPRSILRCDRCRIGIDGEEYVLGFGVCDSCFEERCLCQEARPESCPLHLWPDVVLDR